MTGSVQSPSVNPSIWRLVAPHAKPIIVMNEGSIERHIYCIHSVTGDVGGLNAFSTHFGSLRLHGIQVPKKEMRLHLASTIEMIAAHHVALLEAYQPQGPVNLIGWSAGAIVALEMAQQLRARGREVPLMIALDGAPCNTGAGLRQSDPRYFIKVVANVPRWIKDDRSSDWSLGGISRRLSEKFAASFGVSPIKDVGTMDKRTVDEVVSRPGWSPEQKAFVYNIYRASERYIPQPYQGRVLVFETRTQPLLRLRQVGAAWRAISSALEIVPVAGNHSGLIHEPVAAFLASQVKRRFGCLEEPIRPVLELEVRGRRPTSSQRTALS